MKARLYEKRVDKRSSIAVSLVLHVIAIAMIMSITFRYPLSAFLGIKKEKIPVERIQYVSVQPRARGDVGNGAGDQPKPSPKKKKAEILRRCCHRQRFPRRSLPFRRRQRASVRLRVRATAVAALPPAPRRASS